MANNWVDRVVEALERLGGQGTLKQIYSEIEYNEDDGTNKNPNARVRATLQEYSSDSSPKVYKQKDDLFRKLSSGVWALRTHDKMESENFGFLVAPTDPGWLDFLANSDVGGRQVNFWRPGSAGFTKSNIGKRIVFVRRGKSPRKIMGHGLIVDFLKMTPTQAWNRWGTMNGVQNADEFNQRLGILRDDLSITSTREIGCIVLSDVAIFDEDNSPNVDEVFSPSNGLAEFKTQVVTYKKYNADFPEQLGLSIMETIEKKPENRRGNVTPEQKKAIELRAIEEVMSAFSSYDPVSVESPTDAERELDKQYPGFDIFCRDSGLKLEVKGTSSRPWKVRVSHNEMTTASEDDEWRLCVVHGISLDFSSGRAEGTGGELSVYKVVDKQTLRDVFEAIPNIDKCTVTTNWTISEGCEYFQLVDNN